jgi:hypothetical protein
MSFEAYESLQKKLEPINLQTAITVVMQERQKRKSRWAVSPADFGKFIVADIVKWTKVVKFADLKAE